jgi:hypothetical protein
MKMHLVFYNIWGLNEDGKAFKLHHYLRGMGSHVNIFCFQEHKIQIDDVMNIGKVIWPNVVLWIVKQRKVTRPNNNKAQ